MKKCIILITVVLLSGSCYKANAQFKFILNGLNEIGGFFDAGDGYVATIESMEQAHRALDLINESRCLIDNMSYSLTLYEEQIGYDCFDEVKFKLIRVKLDNSAIQIADQVVANGQQVLNIFTGIIGGQGDEQTISAINKTVVSNAIDQAIEALFAAKEAETEARGELQRLERINSSLATDLAISEIMLIPPAARQSKLRELDSKGDSELQATGGLVSLLTSAITILILIATGYNMIIKGESISPATIIGLLAALVTLSVVNTLI